MRRNPSPTHPPAPAPDRGVIAEIVDQAPPLTEAQRANIAALLRGGAR